MSLFTVGFLLGIYSYIIFGLGLLSQLKVGIIIPLTIVYFTILVFIFIKKFDIQSVLKVFKNKSLALVSGLISLQALVNLIGALGPELSFDALWYHLTLPKLYLAEHSIFFIPGGLLYYSAMPKLAEMLYIAGLSFGDETIPKLVHYSFGLLTCITLYKLQRKFFNPFVSLLGVTIFYSNLVVAWESTTAYVDLVRTFFELMALWGFVNWWGTQKQKWLIISAIMLGFAITTKLLALGSLIIFIVLIIVREIRRVRVIKDIGIFVFISLLVPSPWFSFAFINTGNPVYPFFTSLYNVNAESFSVMVFIKEVWLVFARADDPISPLYLIFLPLIIVLWKKIVISAEVKMFGVYGVFAIILWYFTPRTGGGRFILPYLPVFSLLCAAVVNEVLKNKKRYGNFLGKFLITIIIFVTFISIGYRLVANSKYLPVVLGQETKQEFLTKNLNFSFGDFYDTDGYFKDSIRRDDIILLYGIHNLYYADFSFIDSTWVKENDKFNYIITRESDLPKKFETWKLIYENDTTKIKLYKQ